MNVLDVVLKYIFRCRGVLDAGTSVISLHWRGHERSECLRAGGVS